MAMIDIAIGEETVRYYLEKGNGDGGSVVVYLKPLEDGSYAVQREWYLDYAQGKTVYESVTVETTIDKLSIINARLATAAARVK